MAQIKLCKHSISNYLSVAKCDRDLNISSSGFASRTGPSNLGPERDIHSRGEQVWFPEESWTNAAFKNLIVKTYSWRTVLSFDEFIQSYNHHNQETTFPSITETACALPLF